jgi:hypothetical protein
MEKAPLPKMEKAPFRSQSRSGGGPGKFETFQKGAFRGAASLSALISPIILSASSGLRL